MENNNLNSEIMDKLTKVCICKAITRATITNAIRHGARTVDDVKKVTGARTGSCKGTRCTSKIQSLIEQFENGEYK